MVQNNRASTRKSKKQKKSKLRIDRFIIIGIVAIVTVVVIYFAISMLFPKVEEIPTATQTNDTQINETLEVDPDEALKQKLPETAVPIEIENGSASNGAE